MIFSLRIIIEAFAVDPVSTQGHSGMSGQSEVAIIIIFTINIIIIIIFTIIIIIIIIIINIIIIIIIITRPWPAFGRPGLEWIIGW